MVWDPMLGKYLAFGTLKTAAAGMYLLEFSHCSGGCPPTHPCDYICQPDQLARVDARDDDSPRPCCKFVLQDDLIHLTVVVRFFTKCVTPNRAVVKVFDILLLKNPSNPAPKILSNTPLSVRRKVLNQVCIYALLHFAI